MGVCTAVRQSTCQEIVFGAQRPFLVEPASQDATELILGVRTRPGLFGGQVYRGLGSVMKRVVKRGVKEASLPFRRRPLHTPFRLVSEAVQFI